MLLGAPHQLFSDVSPIETVIRRIDGLFPIHPPGQSLLFDLDQLARVSEGWVGSEIEQAILEAMCVGFDASREFTNEDVIEAIKRQVPLSVSQREMIDALRAWLREGRARSASADPEGGRRKGELPLQLGYV